MLLSHCNTTWSARDVEYDHFNLALAYIVESLEVLNGANSEIQIKLALMAEIQKQKKKKHSTSKP